MMEALASMPAIGIWSFLGAFSSWSLGTRSLGAERTFSQTESEHIPEHFYLLSVFTDRTPITIVIGRESATLLKHPLFKSSN
jgi:hypothetical protein